MTNPTLERAARAGWPAIWHGYTASPKILRMRAETIERARAVLMAVLERDIEGDLVLTQDLKAILNDGEGE